MAVCGISAYRGTLPAAPILLSALHALEYRGYDSAGIATLDGGTIIVSKGVGKVEEVRRTRHLDGLPGRVGIAHTRWATTGAVTERNAHPHLSSDATIAVVHNGIIENHHALREELLADGVAVASETDTELIAHMLSRELSLKEARQAVRDTLARLAGRNAFVAIDARSGAILAAKAGSPLLIGIAPHGIVVASDPAPILPHTRDLLFIDDGEIAVIGDRVAIFDDRLSPVMREPTAVSWSLEEVSRGEHEHFMQKEILEQPTALSRAAAQDPSAIAAAAAILNGADRVVLTGCGTTGAVSLAAAHLLAHIAGLAATPIVASEFDLLRPVIGKGTVLVAFSQSGETADTIVAIEAVRRAGGRVIGVVNAIGSTIARMSDVVLPVDAGPERAVASTKATTSQMAIAALVAHACAGSADRGPVLVRSAADAVASMLVGALPGAIDGLVSRLSGSEDLFLIGRGLHHAAALEGAIKLQEVAYVHAQGFAGGELKHGPLALIVPGTPCIALVPADGTHDDVITNAQEIRLRGGSIIGISPRSHPCFDEWLPVPDLGELSIIGSIVALQMLAYRLGVVRGNDVDRPRNLAKSVTVK